MALHVYTTIFTSGPPAKKNKQAPQVGTLKYEPLVQFKAVVCLSAIFSREIMKIMEIYRRLIVSWHLQRSKSKRQRKQIVSSATSVKRPDHITKIGQIAFIEAILIRFTRFSKRVDMEVSTLVSVTHASCILHNLRELQKNDFLPLWRENEAEDVVVAPVDDNLQSDAESIRDALADLFSAQ